MPSNENLWASEVLLASALQSETLAALVSDERRRTIYCNEGFTRMTGYELDDLFGRSCAILQGVGTDALTIAEIGPTLDAGRTYRGRLLNYRRDGTPFWNELTISPVRDAQGLVVNFVSVQRDVTDEVEANLSSE